MADLTNLLTAPPAPPDYCLLWAHKWWAWGDPWWLCMSKSEWSGWAQAVGSILAIAAGFGFVLLQRHHAREAAIESRRQERRRTLQVCISVFTELMAASRRAEQALQQEDARLVDIAEDAGTALETLGSLPLMELGDAAIVIRVSLMKKEARHLKGNIDRLAGYETLTPEMIELSAQHFGKRTKRMQSMIEWFTGKLAACSTLAELQEGMEPASGFVRE